MKDNLYCFSREGVLVCATNGAASNQVGGRTSSSSKEVRYTIPSGIFSKGEKVCNVFWGSADCQVVQGDGNVLVALEQGEVKVFQRAGAEIMETERGEIMEPSTSIYI